MRNCSAGRWPQISFGSEICGDPRLAAEREWLVTNGLGGYAMGTVSGAPSRSYHGLLIAALSPPVERTLLVSQLQESVDGDPGACGPLRIVSFALEGTVPRWRFAWGETLLEKRVWMAQGANTTYVSYRLERGLRVRPHNGVPFVLRSDRGRWSLEAPPLWVEGLPLAAEARRGLVSTAEHLRAITLAINTRASPSWPAPRKLRPSMGSGPWRSGRPMGASCCLAGSGS